MSDVMKQEDSTRESAEKLKERGMFMLCYTSRCGQRRDWRGLSVILSKDPCVVPSPGPPLTHHILDLLVYA